MRTKQINLDDDQRQLRREAERRLVNTQTSVPGHTPETLQHDLQVHQIELEMQNEALRQAQLQLEESRDRYVDLYEFAPVGYLTISANGLIEQANLTGASLLSVDRRKLLHRRFATCIALEDRERWQRHFARVVKQGDTRNIELALLRGDGSSFHAVIGFASPSATRSDVRLVLSDISERLNAEAEMRIAAIAFHAQEGMVVMDAQGILLRVNQAFTQLTGYSADETIGKTLSLLLSGHQSHDFYEQMWQTLQVEGYWQGEVWDRRKDGRVDAEWLIISSVRGDNDEITHYVGTFSDITKNKEAEAEIHRLAYYDPLTRLPNRRLLIDRLGQAIAAGSRSHSYGALLFLDMDNFKDLNDTRGHAIGDQLLGEVAKRIQDCVREGDTVARLGGDEFVMVLDFLNEDANEATLQTEHVGEKVRQALSQVYELNGEEFYCAASIGATLFRGHEATEESLLKQADLALYQAKNAGRNCLRFFDPSMQSALDEHTQLVTELRQAIRYGQLHLHYQPQLDSHRRVFGAEALLRWSHPQRGEIAPGIFIPLAEKTGLILPIGRWVMETACAQLHAWSKHVATRDLLLSVNVSVRQFHQEGFVAEVREVLRESGADPSRLKIELTESLVIDSVAETIQRMEALQALGIGLSMDDFGTGFSSLSYLTRLPLEQLKIDGSFVENIVTDPNAAAIVQTITTMGRTLSMDVIAEGVETEAQLERLIAYGCAAFQGFLYCRPVDVDEFETFLRRHTLAE